MAVSLVVLAARPPEWTQDRFTAWWRGDHADVARTLPGLIAYRHGYVTTDYDNRDAPAWDGHAVLTFADRAALDNAFASPQWAVATAQTTDMRGKRIILITEEVDLLAVPVDTTKVGGATHG